jgi:hypothetical protein
LVLPRIQKNFTEAWLPAQAGANLQMAYGAGDPLSR